MNRKSYKNDIENSDIRLKKILQMSAFLSLSVIFQIAETFIIIPFFLPGIKLGLANIITIVVLYIYGTKAAFKIGLMRVVLSGILRNGLGINFLFSLMGMLLSVSASSFLKKSNRLSVVGVSIGGANFHVIGQIMVASFIYKTNLLYVSYLPYMLLVTLITGSVTGYLAERILKRVDFEIF